MVQPMCSGMTTRGLMQIQMLPSSCDFMQFGGMVKLGGRIKKQ